MEVKDGVFVDNTGRVRDVVTWLAEALQHPWAGSSGNILSENVLKSVVERFAVLDPRLKVKVMCVRWEDDIVSRPVCCRFCSPS